MMTINKKIELLTYKNEIKDFINSNHRNQWFRNEKIKFYLRKGYRVIDGNFRQTLDIASIEVDEKYQNQGLCKDLINIIHKINPYYCTYIENILNEYLEIHLKNENWIKEYKKELNNNISNYYLIK